MGRKIPPILIGQPIIWLGFNCRYVTLELRMQDTNRMTVALILWTKQQLRMLRIPEIYCFCLKREIVAPLSVNLNNQFEF